MVSNQLESALQSIIKLRQGNAKQQKQYEEAFMNEDVFVSFKDEFIPLELIKTKAKPKGILEEINKIAGPNQILQTKDKELSAFYRNHHLKRDIYTIADSISYYVIPNEKQDITPSAIDKQFIDVNKIIELSAYADKDYNAKDKGLKSIGAEISKNVLMPVNFWLDTLNFSDLAKEPERYWQVAGTFKPFLWGKLYQEEHKDKKVFFSVGIDLRNQTVFYGLDCLRSGSNKLTAEQLLKFDHYTAGKKLRHEIPLNGIVAYNWNKLNSEATTFIKENERLYHELIAYIWANEVNPKEVNNKLLKLKFEKDLLTNEGYETNDKLDKIGMNLVLDYEVRSLLLREKDELAKQVKLTKGKGENGAFDIESYNLDGTLKLIKVVTTKSMSIDGHTLKSDVINHSQEAPEKSYLYIVLNCSKKRKSGLLMIRKGSFESSLSLEPTEFRIGIQS